MIQTRFKSTARSYYDIYSALVAAYPSLPTYLWKEDAALFEFSAELLNNIASDVLRPKTRESAYGFASRCAYDPVEADGATGTLTFTLVSTMSKTLAAGYQVGGISASTGEMVFYELTAAASVVSGTSISASVKQQKTITSHSLGQVVSTDDYFDMPIDGYTGIIKTSISLSIAAQSWTRVDNFDNSISTDRHFVLLYQSNGKSRVQFGNGTNGQKPSVGQEVLATFAWTLGLSGQMDADTITINIGADPDVQSLTNAAAITGGSDAESVASIIRNSAANVRLRDAVWSEEDLVTAARSASSSVQKALGIPGIGAAVIHVVPSGGGTPGAPLLATVESTVQALTQFGVMPVTASAPTYVTVNITATVTVRSGFTAGTVRNLVAFGLALASSPVDNQVIEYYDDNGIDACRTAVINTVWAYAFTSAENEALEVIVKLWKELLGSREYREWGQALEVGDLWIMGNSLYEFGADVFALTAPTTNQTATSTQIIKHGTVTVT